MSNRPRLGGMAVTLPSFDIITKQPRPGAVENFDELPSARRAESEIVKLTEAGTITVKSAAAYRAHITKRTMAA